MSVGSIESRQGPGASSLLPDLPEKRLSSHDEPVAKVAKDAIEKLKGQPSRKSKNKIVELKKTRI